MQLLYMEKVEVSFTSSFVVGTGFLKLSLQHLRRNFPAWQNCVAMNYLKSLPLVSS